MVIQMFEVIRENILTTYIWYSMNWAKVNGQIK